MNIAIFFAGRINSPNFEEGLKKIIRIKDKYNPIFFISINKDIENEDVNREFKKQLNINEERFQSLSIKAPEKIFTFPKRKESNYFNVYSQHFHNKECIKLIERYEETHQIKFDIVIKYRTDFKTDELINLTTPIKENICYIPSGEDHLGINDRICYGTKNSLKIYCSLVDNIIALCENQKVIFHPETLLLAHLAQNNMMIERFTFDTEIQKNMSNNEYYGWSINTDLADAYIDTIKQIVSNEELFQKFRSGLNGYTPILEHLSFYDGLVYFQIIKKKYPHLFSRISDFKDNDSVGSPHVYDYPEIGQINPTTLRYIKVAGDIQSKFGNLDNMDLIEIGGGYGGLINILNKLFKFNSIRLLDLPEVLQLQKKYLHTFNVYPSIDYTAENIITNNSLVVSNYSWNELNFETRQSYLDKVIGKAKYAFITTCDPESRGQLISLAGIKELAQEEFDRNCTIFTNKQI